MWYLRACMIAWMASLACGRWGVHQDFMSLIGGWRDGHCFATASLASLQTRSQPRMSDARRRAYSLSLGAVETECSLLALN